MAAVSKLKRTYTASFITGSGIILFALYYIFIYIPEKEEKINARYYRVLQRMSDNLNTKLDHYQHHVAPNYVMSTIQKYDSIVSIHDPLVYKGDSLAYLHKKLTELAKNSFIPPGEFGVRLALGCAASGLHVDSSAAFLHIPAELINKESTLKKHFHTAVPLDSFLLPLIRWDSFNSFALLRKTSKQDPMNQDRLLFLTKQRSQATLANLIPIDTLLKLTTRSAWQAPSTLLVAGVPHKLFMLSQRLGPEEEWILIGAVSGERYDVERKAIPSHALTFASLSFAILFLSFPFLKLVLMSKEERLYKRDMVLSVVALFFGIALVVLLLLDSYAYYGPDKTMERKRLEGLNKALRNNMLMEIKEHVSQLKTFDNLGTDENILLLQQQDSLFENPLGSSDTALLHRQQIRHVSIPPQTCYRLLGTLDGSAKREQVIINEWSPRPFAMEHLLRTFWLDSTGNMCRVWTPLSTITKAEGGSISKRAYFNELIKGRGWALPEEKNRFYLQSISSLTYGGKYAVISTESNRQSKNEKVVAFTTKLASLYDSVLPPGHGFCVIDGRGDVLFHHNEDLNLSENLLEETSQDPVLKTALFASVPTHLVLDYQGVRRSMYIEPIENLPLFMVTYVNHDSRRAINVDVILHTLISFLLYSFVLVLLISLVIYGRKRLSKLSFSWLAFRWLWPRSTKADRFVQNLFGIVVTMMIVVSMVRVQEPVALFFLLLYAATYIFIYCYACLHTVPFVYLIQTKTSYYASRLRFFLFSAGFVVFCINMLCLIASQAAFEQGIIFQSLLVLEYILVYLLLKRALLTPKKIERRFILTLLVILILIIAAVLFKTESKLPLILICFNIALLLLTFIVRRFFPKLQEPAPESPTKLRFWLKKKYLPIYVLMVLAWLLLTSALPALYLFQLSYNLEAARKTMVTQLFLADRIKDSATKNQIFTGLISLYQGPNSPTPDRYAYTNFFQQTFLDVDTIKSTNRSQEPTGSPVQMQDNVGSIALGHYLLEAQGIPLESRTQLMSSFTNSPLWFLDIASRDEVASACKNGDCSFNRWYVPEKHRLSHRAARLTKDGHQIMLNSAVPHFILPPLLYPVQENTNSNVGKMKYNKSGILFWADVLILLFLMYHFISFLINRIFNLQLLPNIRMSNLNAAMLSPDQPNRLYVISLPGAPTIRKAIGLLNTKNQSNSEILECSAANSESVAKLNAEICKSALQNKRLVYIRNLEELSRDEQTLQHFVHALQKLKEYKDIKVVIESSLHPSYWEKIKNPDDEKSPVADRTRQLHELLGDYTKLYNPLKGNSPPLHAELHTLEKEDLLIEFVRYECGTLSSLEQYKQVMMDHIRMKTSHHDPIEKEDIVYKIQSLAQLYYRRLWATCTEEEQFFLYDLAQDGLVNGRNLSVLSSLLGKGLIVKGIDMKLRIVNESFKNFVLTVVDPADALRYEKRVASTSSWHAYRTPFLLIIIGIGLFIFFTQKQAWLNIVAVGTAVTTILTLLPRLSVLLPAFLVNKDAK